VADRTSEAQEFFEAVRRIEASRTEFDRTQLLAAFGDALAAKGHAALARAEPEAVSSEQISGLLVPVLFWGLGSSAAIAIGAPIWAWFVLSLGIAIAYFVVASKVPGFATLIAWLLLLVWAVVPLVFVLTEPRALIWTYAVPIGGALLVAVALRSLRLRQAKDVAQALAGVARSLHTSPPWSSLPSSCPL
jgi:hypothetical protein